MNNVQCLWCEASAPYWLEDKRNRTYYRCTNCDFTFVPTNLYLSREEEKLRYDQHNNEENEGYVNFLGKLFNPIMNFISEGDKGLDFGCGPNPVLAKQMVKRGYAMNVYDPFYAKDDSVLNEAYDFITCTEAIEHMYNPKTEIKRILSLIKPGGCLGLMTDFCPKDKESFFKWYYKEDNTHVGFYSEMVFDEMAHQFNLERIYTNRPAVIFRKKQ